MQEAKVDQDKIKDIRARVQAKAEQERAEYTDLEPDGKSQFTSHEILKACRSNQDGDAWVFIGLNQGRFIYDHANGKWYQWAGHYWQEDETGRVFAKVQDIIEVYGEESQRQSWARLKAEKAGNTDKATTHKANEGMLLERIRALQSLNRKKNVLILASCITDNPLGISGREWDTDPWKLGCLNGVVDLKTGKHRPGRPDDFIKTVAPINWQDIDEPCPTWERFLSEIFDSDKSLVSYMQRLFGYCITGKVINHAHPILWGQGRNGKGTLLETLGSVLGEIAGQVEAEMLLQQRTPKPSGGPTSDIMALKGKRLVWTSETDEGRKLNIGKLKWLTGGDTLTGRELYGKRQISFKPTHKILLMTNHKPHVPANDYALWERLHLIPFTFSFVEKPKKTNERKADPNLPDKLKTEGPGILAWLVRGCLDWQRQGLKPPEIIKAATNAYRQDEDLVGKFINERCIVNDQVEVRAGQLYKAYQGWCDEMRHKAMSGTRFGQEMKKRFDWRQSNYVFYLGIGLRDF